MKVKYIYKSDFSVDSDTAVIVLPEIFGITDFVKTTADKFAKEFRVPSYALDFFYQITGENEVYDYEKDRSKAHDLMDQMTGEDFVNIFEQAVDHIIADQPGVKKFVVCGFCFGGRLAYMSAIEERVKKIISFYGAGANTANYYSDNSPVELLCGNRASDESLSVLSLYGADDDSISNDDRDLTKKLLSESNISYLEVVYPNTGHAFFNDTRESMYNAESAQKAWHEVTKFVQE